MHYLVVVVIFSLIAFLVKASNESKSKEELRKLGQAVYDQELEKIMERLRGICSDLDVIDDVPMLFDRMLLSLTAKMNMHYYEDVFRLVDKNPPYELQKIRGKVEKIMQESKGIADSEGMAIPHGDDLAFTVEQFKKETKKIIEYLKEDKLEENELIEISGFIFDRMARLTEASEVQGSGEVLAKPEEAFISDTKKCPYCAEDIKQEAIKCKHCGSALLA